MTNHPKSLQETLAMFDEKYKCIQKDCDGNGCIPYPVDDGVWEADQCQFHAEYLFPIKELLTTIWHAGRESVVEDCKGMKCDVPLEGSQSYALGYNSALSDVITKLSELKEKK